MEKYNLVALLVFILVLVALCLIAVNKNRKAQEFASLTEEELKPYLEKIDVENEKRVRKWWLISFVAFSLLIVAVTFLSIVGDPAFAEMIGEVGMALTLPFAIGIALLAVIPWVWITYHCAYTKRGTLWLLLTIIAMPLKELISVFKGEYTEMAGWDGIEWLIAGIFLAVEIFYWLCSIRLRRVNAERERQLELAYKVNHGNKESSN